MSNDSWKRARSHNVGPGGVKCPCCFDYHGDKAKERRITRRRMKHAAKNEVRRVLVND